MSEKLTLVEFNGLTKTEVIRELSPEEKAEREELALEQEAIFQAEEAKAAAKASARAKLAELGLTEEEIAAL